GHGAAAPPVRHHAPRRAGQAPLANRNRLLPGRGRGAGRVIRPEPVLPPLQAPRRRHAKSVPDALKNRLKAAKLAKRPGGRLSTIQSRPRRESPSLAGEIAGRPGGSRSGSFESPPAGSTLLSGLAEADQPPVALALPGRVGLLRDSL